VKASKSFTNWLLLFYLGAVLSGGCRQEGKGIVEEKEVVREVEFEKMEFRADGLWYLTGEDLPFSGKAVRRHSNGVVSWITELDTGVPIGRVKQFSTDGKEIWPGGLTEE